MRIVDLQQLFPDKFVSIDLADRAFHFSREQREMLSGIEISDCEIEVLRKSARGLLVPFSGACLKELSKVTFGEIGMKDAPIISSLRGEATRLAIQEQREFLKCGWYDGAARGIERSEATATTNFEAFLRARREHPLLQDDFSSTRSTFLERVVGVGERDPVMTTPSDPSWLLLAEGSSELSDAREARLNELVGCAMGAAVVGTVLRERIGNGKAVPVTVQRQPHGTDSTTRIFPTWETRISKLYHDSCTYDLIRTPVLEDGMPVPTLEAEQFGVTLPNSYFRTQDARRDGKWLGVGCTEGTGTLIINGDTFVPTTLPPVAKIVPLTQRRER